MLILWAQFAAATAIILVSGIKHSNTAGESVKSGKFSANFMGVFFLAIITSFPEIFTTIASVTKVHALDLGVGDLIGSVILNLMIVVMLDFKFGAKPVLSSVSKDHIAISGFSILMLGILLASMAAGVLLDLRLGLFRIGLEGPLIAGVYIWAMYHIFNSAKKDKGERRGNNLNAVKVYSTFAICGAVIIFSGYWLACIGKEIVDLYGWNEMYFGTIMVAFATSLPEIVVSAVAISSGSINMGIANILGSNLFNIGLIPILDILFRKGYILEHISSTHILSVCLAILLTIVLFFSVYLKPKKTFARLGVGTIIMIVFFITGNFILYSIIH